jgi:hypothetical protein
MLPTLTPQEKNVVALLRRARVASLAQLRAPAQLCHMTVFRALTKAGYYTSLNHNSAWYTLHETPRFDAEGLWSYRQWTFSRHGTLTQTLRVLVEGSAAGYTVSELESKVQTHPANLLCRLCQTRQLACQRYQRQAVYLAVDAARQARQWHQRLAASEAAQPAEALALPAEWEVLGLLRLLVQMIQNPRASAAQLAHQLQAQGCAYSPGQVHQAIAFYDLKKKRHVRGR